ncbi:CaiB/BaiF CoA transferase family protein [Wenxinia marina]|uniref:Putative acyl-CoA transferase/carnitine dehydratase n=1 Tax=Wenxinia marina DSM 24838 TaxID=1123501 RepID=A0A0D0QC05_9RHOB|nr:CoA transferase [Wenxinia marina]KIQ69822.1 putative acyl-CoA transferase/carnitine dehydratase [Wenxinia marina DSM 24838]GGL61516.1 formyl-CoA transferase [Wenxinia marina]
MGALDGVRIADFSWVGAGPRSTKDLADNGATVVKIESARRLDLGRRSPPFAKGESRNHDASAFFAQTNTSKMSVTINLGDARGVEVAKRLVAWADVVVENFGPGYMDRIGLGWDVLQEINPGVILASVSVAGRSGPMAGFRGYGNSAAAHSGHAVMSGWPGTDPHMPPFAYGDVVAPMFLTVGILAALERRERTGQGGHVDVSQIEPMVHVLADLFAETPQEKPANADPLMAPHGVWPCAGADRWIAIACEDDAQWAALREVLDLPAEDRFATAGGRKAAEAELDALVAGMVAGRDRDELAQVLAEAGVPAGPVTDGRDLATDPALTEAGHFVQVPHPVLGPSAMPAPPMRLSATPWEVGPSPCLGQHNKEVFEGLLGMAPDEAAALAEEGVLA